MSTWLIIGISGITCGGKTTLSQSLYDHLSNPANESCISDKIKIGTVKIMNQDDYFYSNEYQHHEWIEQINHVNYDVIGALNMTKMCNDLYLELGKRFIFYTKQSNINTINIMIIDGFLLFNHGILNRICQLKFHIHLPYEKSYERRMKRSYDPPDVLGYFELCVWPMYQQNFDEIKNKEDLILLNGETSKEKVFQYVFECIKSAI